VLYHGPAGWRTSVRFEDHVATDAETANIFAPFVPHYGINLTDLSHYSDAELRRDTTNALLLVLLKHIRDEDLGDRLPQWFDMFSSFAREKNGLQRLRLLLLYLLKAAKMPPATLNLLCERVTPETKEAIMTTAQLLHEEGREKGREEGREEGREKGREEGRRQSLTRLLTLKFGVLSDSVAIAVQKADSREIDRLTDAVLTAESIDQLFPE